MTFIDNWFFWAFVAFYVAYLVLELGLDFLNMRYVENHKNSIPELFKNIFSLEDYKKSIAYTHAKTNFKIFSLVFRTIIVFALIFTNFFDLVDNLIKSLVSQPFLQALIYPFAIGAFFFVIGLPLSLYNQFVLEERFSFNRMTIKTFIGDQIKVLFLSVLFGAPLFALLLWAINISGEYWWLLGFALIMGFQLFTAAIYPVFLAPLFNKFTPLADGSLKDKIIALAKRVNFKMAGIFTIDGSKRSSHSNAFFAGMGSMRRIVLFDTLIEKQSEDEIVAIIAHEIGHNAKKHIQKGLLLSAIVLLISFYVLALCLKWPLFFAAFGVQVPSTYVGIVLFSLFSSVFTFPIVPLFTSLSRKNEFEADAYSVEISKDKEELKKALVKLTKENLGNLTPHPWYSAYHYSHPSTIERVKAIDAIVL
jgi:STE24 endopeptidase